jgi:transposase
MVRLGRSWLFQIHAASKDGRPVLRKKVSQAQKLGFLAKQPRAIVAMEACATTHEWGRAISGLGHDDPRRQPRLELDLS